MLAGAHSVPAGSALTIIFPIYLWLFSANSFIFTKQFFSNTSIFVVNSVNRVYEMACHLFAVHRAINLIDADVLSIRYTGKTSVKFE